MRFVGTARSAAGLTKPICQPDDQDIRASLDLFQSN
jgi:hypothetical protein